MVRETREGDGYVTELHALHALLEYAKARASELELPVLARNIDSAAMTALAEISLSAAGPATGGADATAGNDLGSRNAV